MPEALQRINVATQTDESMGINYESLAQTARLSAGAVWKDIGRLQSDSDAAMGERIADASATTVSPAVSRCDTFNAYIGNPIDARPYIDPISGQLGLSKLEDNSIGWGRILSVPQALLRNIGNSLTALGLALAGQEDTVTVFGYSGGNPRESANQDPAIQSVVGNKIWIVDRVAEGLRRSVKTFVLGFDRATIADQLQRVENFAGRKATVIVGSYVDMLAFHPGEREESLITMADGQVLFCGKRVHCVLNELFVSYIEARFAKINRMKTWVSPSVYIGTDKAKAYDAHNAFVKSPAAHEAEMLRLAAPIQFQVCHSEAEVLAAADFFNGTGKGYVCKPKGTLAGRGIIVSLPGEHEPQVLTEKLHLSSTALTKHFGDSRYAGWPYSVCEYIKSPLIHVPEDLQERYGYLEGYQFELRIGVCKRLNASGLAELISVPTCIRLQHPSSLLSNITVQVRDLKLSAADLLLPALNQDAMRLTGFNEATYTEMARFFARYQAFAISREMGLVEGDVDA